jgi:hypothetical protein
MYVIIKNLQVGKRLVNSAQLGEGGGCTARPPLFTITSKGVGYAPAEQKRKIHSYFCCTLFSYVNRRVPSTYVMENRYISFQYVSIAVTFCKKCFYIRVALG